MARTKPTAQMVDNLMHAVIKEAQSNGKLPDLCAAIIGKMYQRDPEKAEEMLDRLFTVVLLAMPEDEREAYLQKLLEELPLQ